MFLFILNYADVIIVLHLMSIFCKTNIDKGKNQCQATDRTI